MDSKTVEKVPQLPAFHFSFFNLIFFAHRCITEDENLPHTGYPYYTFPLENLNSKFPTKFPRFLLPRSDRRADENGPPCALVGILPAANRAAMQKSRKSC
jgi:hypothetical protein